VAVDNWIISFAGDRSFELERFDHDREADTRLPGLVRQQSELAWEQSPMLVELFRSPASLHGQPSHSGDGLLRKAKERSDLAGCELHPLADILDGRFPAQILNQIAPGHAHPVHHLEHVHGDADGARLVGDGPADRLADPPGGVSGELKASAVIELLHRPQEAQVALLDEVEERHPPPRVAFGDGDDQSQVRLHQLAAGEPSVEHELSADLPHLGGRWGGQAPGRCGTGG
jgi:hypothetical protein